MSLDDHQPGVAVMNSMAIVKTTETLILIRILASALPCWQCLAWWAAQA